MVKGARRDARQIQIESREGAAAKYGGAVLILIIGTSNCFVDVFALRSLKNNLCF